MTLDELLAKLPPELHAIAIQYGPTVLKMSMEDLQAWLDFVFVGDYIAAYEVYLKAANTDLLAEWGKVEAEWQTPNEKNAAKLELSREIATAAAKALVAIVLAVVGF